MGGVSNFIGTSSRERSAASRGISRETSGGGRQGWGRQLEPQLWLSFSLALMSSQRGTHSALSQPSQEDACAEAFSQDSRGVRIKAATALSMVAVVEVSESQIIGIWITQDHSGSLWIVLDHTGIQ